MKAIILMAGQGSRLRPYTDHCPKGMLKIDGKTILDHQIENFHKAGVSEIAIVTGYKAESVSSAFPLRQFINQAYAVTNMVQSLLCAEAFVSNDEEVIISYSDILYRNSVLSQLIACEAPHSVVVDSEWKLYYSQRFEDPYMDAESLVMDDRQLIQSIGKPNPAPEEVQAQYIGLIKLNGHTIKSIKQIIKSETSEIGWGRNAVNCYVTDILQELIWRGEKFRAVSIQGGWLEIDTIQDYHIAMERYPQIIKEEGAFHERSIVQFPADH